MLDDIKNSRVIKPVYKLPGLVSFYHFLWAIFGVLVYGRPDKKIFVIGVTGTKGKTTTLELLNSILEESGKKTALLSSLRVKIGDKSEKNMVGNTMPGRLYIKKFLRLAVKAGCRYALIEVTSQGVEYFRHKFIAWNVGVLTNIAPEHIESHGSFENYRQAKFSFLKYVLDCGGKVFVNREDKNSEFFVEKLSEFGAKTYSRNDRGMAGFLAASPMSHVSGVNGNEFLSSDFNRDNAAAAVAVMRELGIEERFIETALRSFGGVPGRMEFVAQWPFSVVVDYAHTPESLSAVYGFLRSKVEKTIGASFPAAHPRLICVLGAAGGGRDKWKRPILGKIAASFCDELVLTNEDPYDEDPGGIIDQVAEGCHELKPPSHVFKIADRASAISKAISFAEDGDVVVITGKGSEDFIHLARGKKIPWSDKKVVEAALRGVSSE